MIRLLIALILIIFSCIIGIYAHGYAKRNPDKIKYPVMFGIYAINAAMIVVILIIILLNYIGLYPD